MHTSIQMCLGLGIRMRNAVVKEKDLHRGITLDA